MGPCIDTCIDTMHTSSMTTTQTTTAADYFITAAAKIVKATGCTVEQAVDTLLARMATERPELLAKVAAGSGVFAA